MANEFIARKGYIALEDSQITGSLSITGNITGSTFSGSFVGDGSQLGGVTTASYVEYNDIANKPTLVSGSEQISFNGITDKPTLVSGSEQISFNGITDKPTLVSSSSQITYSDLTGIPSGIVSGSSQITYSGLTGIPSGIVSGSAQIAALGYATTGSNQFNGDQAITGSLTTTGTIVAQTLNVQQVTSSVVYSSGSNVFGNSVANTQQFTGSVGMTGSLTVDGTSFTQNIESSGIVYTDILQNYTGGTTPLTIKTGGGQSLILQTNSTDRLTISSTGAATFSSSVTIEGSFTQIRSGNELRFWRSDNAIYTKMFDAGSTAANGFTFDNLNAEGFHFKNNGTTIMRMNSTGNVGIGTSSPSNKLSLFESGASGIAIADISGGASGAGVLQLSAGKVLGSTSFDLIQNVSGAYVFQRDNNPLIFGTNNTDRMRITSGGNVGIGTDSPSEKLEVSGTGNQYIKSTATDGSNAGIRMNSVGQREFGIFSDGALRFYDFTASTERMRITSTGDVGIGTTSPSHKLHVSGRTFLNNGTGNALYIDTTIADDTTRDAIYLVENDGQSTGRQAISWYNETQNYYKARLWTQVGSGYNATVFGIDVADDSRTVDTRLAIRNGNVGIGTISPIDKLNIVGGATFTSTLSNPSNTSVGSLQVGYDGTQGVIQTWNSSPLLISTYNYQAFNTNGSERMRIAANGNVAIGDSSVLPTSAWFGALTLGKSGTDKIVTGYVSSSTNGAVIGAHNSALSAWATINIAGTNILFRSAETERMRVTSDGNVGINTTSPSSRLSVCSTTACSTVVDVQGCAGQLFSITDNLVGEIFAVSDISGIPILSVNSNGTVSVDSKIAVGANHTVSGNYASVTGGICNIVTQACSTIGGGKQNCATNCFATIGGGWYNRATGYASVVAGGGWLSSPGYSYGVNCATGNWSTISGGYSNQATGQSSTIIGGYFNRATSDHTIAGGSFNYATNRCALAMGGSNNCANGCASTSIGGFRNYATALASWTMGGTGNRACHNYSVAANRCQTTSAACQFRVEALSKASGTFQIKHPNPEKRHTHHLNHSFVESPTAGDNIYRYVVEIVNGVGTIELPSYYKFLNENDQVFVTPKGHYGVAYGEVNEEQTEVNFHSSQDGLYNVLIIGTRKDFDAVHHWQGVESYR